jgi:hypothetical protein
MYPTTSNASLRGFVVRLLKLSEITNNVHCFLDLARAPATRTMEIVDKKRRALVDPIEFMGFGLSVFSLGQISKPLLGDNYSFLEQTLLIPLYVLLIAATLFVLYQVFRRLSAVPRTFEDYLVMSALMCGVMYPLYGLNAILLALNPVLGGMATLLIYPYTTVYSLKVFKQFWGISYGKIVLYSLIFGGAVAMAIFLIAMLFVFVFVSIG